MPIVDVSIAQGRSVQEIGALIVAVTDAVARSLDAPRDSIRVLVREVPRTHWSAGGMTLAERAAGIADRQET